MKTTSTSLRKRCSRRSRSTRNGSESVTYAYVGATRESPLRNTQTQTVRLGPQEFLMFKSIFISLVLSLVPSLALAQAVAIPTDTEITAAKAACETKYNPNTAPTTLKVSIALAQEKCKLEVDVKVLQLKAQASGVKNDKIDAELAHQRTMLDSISKSLKALESAPKADPKPAAPAPQTPAQATLPPPPAMMGAPFQVIEPVGNYAAATWNIFGGTPFHVELHSINSGGAKWFARAGMQRVVVRKNGQLLAIAHKGPGPAGVRFVDFYTDLNNDKKPDANPAKGIDPSEVDTIFLGYQQGDVIELIYLVPVSTVAVPGFPLQIVWGKPRRTIFYENAIDNQAGRLFISARTGDPKY